MMLLKSHILKNQMPQTAHAGAESKADKKSHLQINVATVIAPLGQPRHATLATWL